MATKNNNLKNTQLRFLVPSSFVLTVTHILFCFNAVNRYYARDWLVVSVFTFTECIQSVFIFKPLELAAPPVASRLLLSALFHQLFHLLHEAQAELILPRQGDALHRHGQTLASSDSLF